jgi:chaperonin cofactor prefoldin
VSHKPTTPESSYPPPRWSKTETGRHKVIVSEELEKEDPLPHLPSMEERSNDPNIILRFMLEIAKCHQSYVASAKTSTDEVLERADRLFAEVDDLKGHMINLDGRLKTTTDKLDKFEARLLSVTESQFTLVTKLNGFDKKIENLRTILETDKDNYNNRLTKLETRADQLENQLKQFEILFRADLDARYREKINATTPTTTASNNEAGDAGGPKTNPGPRTR